VVGAAIVGLSKRHFRRVRRGYEKARSASVIHGLAGREPKNKLPKEVRDRIVELARTKYAGFNDTHLVEKLVEVEKMKVSRATVQRLRSGAGLESPQKRRPRKHRRRRERRSQPGAMLLWDGSKHHWLEERGPKLCLMAAIDDATSEVLEGAHFLPEESSVGYLRIVAAIARERGLAQSIYMDRHGSLQRNDSNWTVEEELRGEQFPTQVGRALDELAVERIYALSPQAKGRVERLWRTFQDRLISELRLAGVTTIESANELLRWFIPDFNRRFAVAPRDVKPAWRPLRREIDLDRICGLRFEATVANDNTVRKAGVTIDIPPGPKQRSYAKARVEVVQRLDGSWAVYFGTAIIATAPATPMAEASKRPHGRVVNGSKKQRPSHGYEAYAV
jgi:hypothetical protein